MADDASIHRDRLLRFSKLRAPMLASSRMTRPVDSNQSLLTRCKVHALIPVAFSMSAGVWPLSNIVITSFFMLFRYEKSVVAHGKESRRFNRYMVTGAVYNYSTLEPQFITGYIL